MQKDDSVNFCFWNRASKLFFLGVFLFPMNSSTAAAFSGSASLKVGQRFFDDQKLSHVNGFSEWGAFELNLLLGLHEFPYRIEPLLGFSFIKNSSSLYGLNSSGGLAMENGSPVLSQDRLEYQFYTLSSGARIKAWDSHTFLLIPYSDILGTYRYGRIRKKTYAIGQQKLNVGGDFGAEVTAGVMLSFLTTQKKRYEMESELEMDDFGMSLSASYQPAGWFRHGLGLIDTTGGWSFAGGLYGEW